MASDLPTLASRRGWAVLWAHKGKEHPNWTLLGNAKETLLDTDRYQYCAAMRGEYLGWGAPNSAHDIFFYHTGEAEVADWNGKSWEWTKHNILVGITTTANLLPKGAGKDTHLVIWDQQHGVPVTELNATDHVKPGLEYRVLTKGGCGISSQYILQCKHSALHLLQDSSLSHCGKRTGRRRPNRFAFLSVCTSASTWWRKQRAPRN